MLRNTLIATSTLALITFVGGFLILNKRLENLDTLPEEDVLAYIW